MNRPSLQRHSFLEMSRLSGYNVSAVPTQSGPELSDTTGRRKSLGTAFSALNPVVANHEV